MTFLELTEDDARDLALELFYSGDAPDLDSAAALAADMQQTLATVASDWDFDAECQRIAAEQEMTEYRAYLAWVNADGMRV